MENKEITILIEGIRKLSQDAAQIADLLEQVKMPAEPAPEPEPNGGLSGLPARRDPPLHRGRRPGQAGRKRGSLRHIRTSARRLAVNPQRLPTMRSGLERKRP